LESSTVRGWALLALLTSVGCIGVKPYAGTVMQMTLEVSPSAPGEHLELWARTRFDDIVRISGTFIDPVTKQVSYPYGLHVRNAITLDDPCIVDEHGNLLTSAAAYPAMVTVAGVTQTAEQQADVVKNRIKQLLAASLGGLQSTTLQAIIPYNVAAPPTVAANASAADRLSACQAYWTDPLAYTPNPAQVTAPLHGAVYGFVGYTTTRPPAGYDGLRIDTPVNLRDLRELWVTRELEPAGNPPGNDFVRADQRGPTVMQGVPDAGGRDVVHIDLRGDGGSGTAALLVNLDQDPIQY
jgi:hypothetical protein